MYPKVSISDHSLALRVLDVACISIIPLRMEMNTYIRSYGFKDSNFERIEELRKSLGLHDLPATPVEILASN